MKQNVETRNAKFDSTKYSAMYNLKQENQHNNHTSKFYKRFYRNKRIHFENQLIKYHYFDY